MNLCQHPLEPMVMLPMSSAPATHIQTREKIISKQQTTQTDMIAKCLQVCCFDGGTVVFDLGNCDFIKTKFQAPRPVCKCRSSFTEGRTNHRIRPSKRSAIFFLWLSCDKLWQLRSACCCRCCTFQREASDQIQWHPRLFRVKLQPLSLKRKRRSGRRRNSTGRNSMQWIANPQLCML